MVVNTTWGVKFMETGDIIFFKGKSFISKIIQKLTGSPYTHVAIAISSDTILEADRFIKVRLRSIRDHEVYCIMRYPGLTKYQQSTIFAGGTSFIGAKYDYIHVLTWFVKLVLNKGGYGFIDNANRVYCSELIDRLYLLAGIDLVPDRADGDVLPSHLLDSPLLTQVYVT
jgi:hypothetical protein